MTHDYEVVIVGSGFGGAVTACRLADGGRQVLVLERGRRWGPDDYPRQIGDPWVYSNDAPHRYNGWIEFHIFPHMVVATGAGVGGGSLAYANVVMPPPADTFDEGWPAEITYGELQPWYEEVGRMLNVQTLPDNQLTRRFLLTKEAAEAIGDGHRFHKFQLAVRFNEDWNYNLPNPLRPEHARFEDNGFGRTQGTCVHCAMCDLGCPVRAKNTLDLNYLAHAEDHGVEVRPLHLVRVLEPLERGYRLHFDRIEPDAKRTVRGSVTTRRVVLAAGSLGSTELLLRCRDEHRTLPNLSGALGQRWSSNGDFLTTASYKRVGRTVSPTLGPTITCGIDYLDGDKYGQKRFHVEDGGFPPALRMYLEHRRRRRRRGRPGRGDQGRLRRYSEDAFKYTMPWFANGVDAADGRLYLGRDRLRPWKRKLRMHWDIAKSRQLIDEIVTKHAELSKATGGKPWVPPSWKFFGNLITPHPLGGCNMDVPGRPGVVDHRGKVLGYDDLYVFDGAIVPEATGINPARTIAALAERNVRLLLEEMDKD